MYAIRLGPSSIVLAHILALCVPEIFTSTKADTAWNSSLSNICLDIANCMRYSIAPLIRINRDEEPTAYTENPDNWIFFK